MRKFSFFINCRLWCLDPTYKINTIDFLFEGKVLGVFLQLGMGVLKFVIKLSSFVI